MKKIIFLLLCSFISTNACAAAGWSGVTKVESIYTLSEGTALIKLSSFNNPNNCAVNSSGDIRINPTTQKTWFAVLLAAYMGDKPVNIYVTAACTEVWSGTSYASVGHVRLL